MLELMFLNGRAITRPEYTVVQEAEALQKLIYLKLGMICLYVLFVVLVGSGGAFSSDVVTISGLMAFTAAAALTTYYMVLTQP